jgi:TRAP-type C4-dicarboxylate transport system substrate-binding protein
MDRGYAIKMIEVSMLVALILVVPASGEEKGLVIKLATLAPEESTWAKTFNALNSEIMKKTENKVQFRIYPGGVLGDEKDVLRKMKIGQIQGAALTSGGLSAIYKEIDVLQIPFLFQNYREVDYVLTKMDSSFRKGFEENGYILLGWSEAGFIYLMSTVPIASVSDLKKAKVWIWEESPMSKAIFGEAGVSAIPLSIPDVMVGLQTGLINVVYAPPTGAISLQWFTKIKYMTDVPLAYLLGGLVLRKDTFNQIPPSLQLTILESFQKHLELLKTVTRDENRDAIKVMTKQGVKLIMPSKNQIDEFEKLSNKAIGHITGQSFTKKSLGEVTSLLESYKKGAR